MEEVEVSYRQGTMSFNPHQAMMNSVTMHCSGVEGADRMICDS